MCASCIHVCMYEQLGTETNVCVDGVFNVCIYPKQTLRSGMKCISKHSRQALCLVVTKSSTAGRQRLCVHEMSASSVMRACMKITYKVRTREAQRTQHLATSVV